MMRVNPLGIIRVPVNEGVADIQQVNPQVVSSFERSCEGPFGGPVLRGIV
jgi:hypothetical protein